MENESLILAALQEGVTAAVAAGDDPTLPVKYLLISAASGTQWEGVPDDKKWLELVWIPNNRPSDFIGDEQNHRGILRLIFHWPNSGTGVYEPVDLIASITTYFRKGRLLSGVQVYAKPQPTGIIENGDEVLFPVSIFYQSYRKGT